MLLHGKGRDFEILTDYQFILNQSDLLVNGNSLPPICFAEQAHLKLRVGLSHVARHPTSPGRAGSLARGSSEQRDRSSGDAITSYASVV